MVPFIHVPSFHLFGKLAIEPFGVMVALGVLVGYHAALRHAKRLELDTRLLADAIPVIVIVGIIMAHLVSVIFYFPERIAEHPILALINITNGLSSFGGMIGGFVGGYIFFRRAGQSLLNYGDALSYGSVAGWILGRFGCAIVHDHPGKPSNFFLAVKFPEGARHDLGLYEMLYLILMMIVLISIRNMKRPFHGFYIALVLVMYAPARFFFDQLREVDKRYLGLTPGQYFSLSFIVIAAAITAYGLKQRGREKTAKVNA